MHPVNRRRFGRPYVGTEVDHVAKAQAGQLALRCERRLDLAHAVGRARRRHEVLEPVLGPFHGHAQEAGDGGHQHHVGIHRLLEPEAAARVRWRDNAHAVAGHVERRSHQRLEHERSLEVGPDGVAVRTRFEVRDDSVGLHGRRYGTRVPILVAKRACGGRESRVGIPVREPARLCDVRSCLLEEQRRIRAHRVLQPGNAGQWVVVDLDQLERVLGNIAIVCDHDGDRFTGVARLRRRAHPVANLGADHAGNGAGDGTDLGPGDDANDTRQPFRRGRVDAADARMRMP